MRIILISFLFIALSLCQVVIPNGRFYSDDCEDDDGFKYRRSLLLSNGSFEMVFTNYENSDSSCSEPLYTHLYSGMIEHNNATNTTLFYITQQQTFIRNTTVLMAAQTNCSSFNFTLNAGVDTLNQSCSVVRLNGSCNPFVDNFYPGTNETHLILEDRNWETCQLPTNDSADAIVLTPEFPFSTTTIYQGTCTQKNNESVWYQLYINMSPDYAWDFQYTVHNSSDCSNPSLQYVVLTGGVYFLLGQVGLGNATHLAIDFGIVYIKIQPYTEEVLEALNSSCPGNYTLGETTDITDMSCSGVLLWNTTSIDACPTDKNSIQVLDDGSFIIAQAADSHCTVRQTMLEDANAIYTLNSDLVSLPPLPPFGMPTTTTDGLATTSGTTGATTADTTAATSSTSTTGSATSTTGSAATSTTGSATSTSTSTTTGKTTSTSTTTGKTSTTTGQSTTSNNVSGDGNVISVCLFVMLVAVISLFI